MKIENLSSKDKAMRLISSAYFYCETRGKQKTAAHAIVNEILEMDYPNSNQQDLEDQIEYWEDVKVHIKNYRF